MADQDDGNQPLTANEARILHRATSLSLQAITRMVGELSKKVEDISLKAPAKKAGAKKSAEDESEGVETPKPTPPPTPAAKKGRGKAVASAKSTASAKTTEPAEQNDEPAEQNDEPAEQNAEEVEVKKPPPATAKAPPAGVKGRRPKNAGAVKSPPPAPAESPAKTKTFRAVFIERFIAEPTFKAKFSGEDIDQHLETFQDEIDAKKTETQKNQFCAGKVHDYVSKTDPYKTMYVHLNEQYKLQNASKNAV